ncbi:spermidine resistance protein [Saxophila tyrrhenica]|uniref:Spermidine resistance protein n=1 Tax=Saxophila tyrrhenica TaxID=1690608 RepID=A0AAV9P1Y0_9PEZI|nr:spermidine resistance protein [Saxophila tyrrhenica]
MVNTEIPVNYTNSPSSFNGTPSLTINRDISTLDLESSNAFEGPEKLLEVWFAASEKALPASASPQGLKVVPQAAWKDMLDLVNCKVLSVIESRNVDAYLLSESSMFVFPHKVVLKTCGTTTLLCGLPRMLEIAALDAGFPHVKANLPNAIPAAATPYRIFYSRKNFLYPDQQRGPHRSWRDEVRYMDKMFVGGSAYMIGKMNGEHWYLYITGPGTVLTPPATPDDERMETPTKHVTLPQKGQIPKVADPLDDDSGDETLEILMTDLEENNARQFYLEHASSIAQDNARRVHQARKEAIEHLGVIEEANSSNPSISGNTLVNEDSRFDVFAQTSTDHSAANSDGEDEALTFFEELTTEGHTLGSVVSDTCGLADVYPTSKYPDARIDSYLFTPCGYSANGVVPMPGDGESTNYWTVHVTPEPQCSYASFETNVPTKHAGRETVEVVQQVVGIFKPGRFSVTLFETKSENDVLAAKKDKRMDHVEGYRRVDRIVHDLEGYELVFRYFEREDWKGGAPRLGENQWGGFL